MISELERFAVLPDDYVLTADDTDTLPVVVCGRLNLMVSKRENTLFKIRVGDEEVKTAGDIRAVLRKHPEPKKDQWSDFYSSLAASVARLMEVLTLEQSRSSVTRKLLFEKGIITRDEFTKLVEAERADALWTIRDQLFPLFQSLYPDQCERYH